MSKTWEYSHGDWRRIEEPMPEDPDTEFGVAMERAGYHKEGMYAGQEEFLPMIEIWSQARETPVTERHEYKVWVWLCGDSATAVYVADLPSLLMFLKEYGPVMQRQSHQALLSSVEDFMQKAFHAWHGHALEYEVCEECDPVEVRARQAAAMARRKAEQAKKAKEEK